MVVNGEERDGSYFKIVADYIHLNPVRSGWVGGEIGKRLKSWRWSSFGGICGQQAAGLAGNRKGAEGVPIVPRPPGGRAYAGYLEARAMDPKSAVTDESLKELWRVWYLGEETFGKKVLDALAGVTGHKRKKGSVAGEAASAHEHNEAEWIALAALLQLGLTSAISELAGKTMWVEEKSLVAVLIRKRTGVKNRWLAERLAMGDEGNVTRAIRKVNNDPTRKTSLT